MIELNQPKFRAKQIYEWLHIHHVADYDEMTNLPIALRNALKEKFPLFALSIADKQVSIDGTRKYVLNLADGQRIETVGMPSYQISSDSAVGKLSVCVSSQVGCAMQCDFCATGKEGFTRNLTAEEITDQVLVVQNDFQTRVSSVVVMGQGEPFQNYENVMKALRILNSAESFNIGARHITLSTCGLITGINKLAREPEQFTLAISLHSAIQKKRDKLMPRVMSQKLGMLKQALIDYVEATNRRVSLEYLLIAKVNDSAEDLDALIDFTKGLHCHVNLLPMNSITGSSYKPSSDSTAKYWMNALSRNGTETTIRISRGSDICGACGQLKNSLKS